MKQNRINLLLVAFVSSILLCQNVQADSNITYLTEQFVNYNTGRLGDDLGTGGGGLIPGWNTPKDQITLTNGSGSLDGTSLGLVASGGDKVFIAGTNIANGSYNKFVNAPPGYFPQSSPTNLYYSFLYRFNVGTDVTNVGGQIISGVNRANSGITSLATFHWNLYATRTNATKIRIGINKVGGVTNYAPLEINAGQTFFVVVRQQIITGVTNDIDDLWINPAPQFFGTNEANVPTPDASTSNGTEDPSSTGPGRFWIFASGADANMDEIRIANNWAGVTPWFGQCLSANIPVDLLSQTNVAEIGTSFRVFNSPSTTPTYQWQISGPGSSTWTNISGAVFTTYSTPNLTLASDNGNKYRVIAYVSCDGTYATSTVATVTLTAPVVTPVGLIMDDNFSDTFRGNRPLSITNSLWYTSIAGTANLNCDAGTPLIAIPLPGASSLWWGQFVAETNSVPSTNRPVHLAVNSAIRVTLPFVITSFSSHTNNGALRFGLYDYADGGIVFTDDSAAATGSGGNGAGVRGYMLSVDFGTNFTANSPLSLLARSGLVDNNLMGTTSDYLSLGSGPSGGGYSNAPAFQAGTPYTLVFQVTRIAVSSVRVTATITGGGTNWAYSNIDTNYAYHRFDVFAIRPNSLETSANEFDISRFLVEVIAVAPEITGISTPTISRTGNSVTLTWIPTPAGSYTYSVQRKLDLLDPTWTTLQTGITTTSYTDTTATATTGFYRVSSP